MALERLRDAATVRAKLRALAPLEDVVARALTRMWTAQRRLLVGLADRFGDDRSGVLTAWPDVARETAPPAARTLQAEATAALRSGLDQARDARSDLSAYPAAADWLRNRGARSIRGLDDTTRRGLADLLADAAEQRWPKVAVADAIAARFDGFTPARADLVATTALNDAYEAGRQVVVDALVGQGVVMQTRWLTVGDAEVCPVCRPNGAVGWLPAGVGFPSGHRRPPAHPRCRCVGLSRPARS